MTDNSHWDYANDFSANEAAALILGVDPTSQSDTLKTKPILDRLRSSYHEAWGYWHTRCDGFFTFNEDATLPESAIQSVEMQGNAKSLIRCGFSEQGIEFFSRWVGAETSQDGEFSAFNKQKFSRPELARWLRALGTKSAYPFEASNPTSNESLTGGIENDLTTRERNKLLQILIGMAVGAYRYDPASQKNTATKEIVDDAAALGIKIDDGTVRKYLREASSLFLPGNSPKG